jgi:hypothetical protein
MQNKKTAFPFHYNKTKNVWNAFQSFFSQNGFEIFLPFRRKVKQLGCPSFREDVEDKTESN